MRKLLVFIICIATLTACVSSKKSLQKRQYDKAIRKCVKVLTKNPSKFKEIDVLNQAYKNANDQDNERIGFLKQTGEPDIWNEIFSRFDRMKRRQSLVKTLSMDILGQINYVYINYDQEIIEAKKKAAEFLYAHGKQLLDRKDRQSARLAYSDFVRVKGYYNSFRDVDAMITKAKFMGTNNVLFNIENKTKIPFPPTFEEELTKISLKDLNKRWINYDTRKDKNRYYDYSILVKIKIIDVSPEQLKEVHYEEKRDVKDGWQYVYDDNGNVRKDENGNDMKVDKIKTAVCKIVETQQHKRAIVGGTIDYFNNRTGQLIKTNPIKAEAIFDHFSAIAIGDLDALKPETKVKIGRKPLPFPNDPGMILQAAGILKGMVKDIVHSHKHLIKD